MNKVMNNVKSSNLATWFRTAVVLAAIFVIAAVVVLTGAVMLGCSF
jgi:hypothetical protein